MDTNFNNRFNNCFKLSSPNQILIIDDEPFHQLMLGKLLKQSGYNVLVASSAEQGIELYQMHHPDIVLLDGIMPVIDGFECCKLLRQLPNTESLPILMITGLEEKVAIERAFEVGATDFITKPVQFTALAQRIRRLLKAASLEKALRQSEKQYRSLVTNLEEIIFQTNTEGEFIFLNPAWKVVTGFEIDESLGRNFIEYIHSNDVQRHLKQVEKVLQGKLNNAYYYIRYRMKSGIYGWLDISVTPLKSESNGITGLSGHFSNSTQRRQHLQYQGIAYRVARVLSQSLPIDATLYKVLQAICGNLNWKLAELWQLSPRTDQLQCTQMWHLQLKSFMTYRRVTELTRFTIGEGLPGKVWQTQEPCWISDLSQGNFRRVAVAEGAGLRTAFAFPIMNGQECLGIMAFFSSEYQSIEHELVKFMMSLGRQIGQFMKRKQAEIELQYQTAILQEELKRASTYVQSLLPLPMQQPVEIQRIFLPSLELGGDILDYYWLDDQHLVIYLIDVAGHGVKSALISVSVLNVLRSQTLSKADFYHPASVLAQLNKTFQMSEVGDDYFTIWYGVYNSKTHELTYGTGGHPPAILILPPENNCQIQKLSTQGFSIGMLEDWPYDQETCIVPKGSSLFVFSDGAYEIPVDEEKIWGFDAFTHTLQRYKWASTQSLDAILKEVQQVNVSQSLADDFSLLESVFY